MENGNSEIRPKILLADDSVTIRKVVELTFADEGIDVISVADGDAAMQKFVEYSPDLVIADVNMPGMSGYQICEMIKQDESTCDIPVILLVGSFEPFDAGEAVRVGSNYYFTKPFQSIRDLINKVKEYLEVGSFDHSTPENSDIEDLYQQSIIETPETEPGSEFEAMEDEPGQTTLDETPDTAVEIDELIQATQPEPETTANVELGDAGMDDEIIETVHVSAEPIDDTSGYSADPFAAPAASVEENTPDVSAEETWDSQETLSGAEDVNDRGADLEQATQPLRIAIVDDEPAQETTGEETETAPEPNGSPEIEPAPDLASVELIEIIVKKVIERMSDTAVREVAQEAVPRIAEKLIREALETEKK